MRPELADPRAAASRIEHWHRRLVAEQPLEAVHSLQLQIVEAPDQPRRAPHPARQRLTVDDDTLTRQDLRLAIERRLPGIFGRGDMRDQRRRCHAALDEPRRCRGLDNRALTGAAGVFWTDRAEHAQPRGNPIERFAALLADPMHLTRAARAQRGRRLDHPLDPRQMRRQRADVALRFAPLRPRRVRFVVIGREL
ncbi:putative ubiquitin-RnfH superfamily antitoxin RatB of RatAB toxin-antitoxin module [Bradyrhizobium liaoningense]